MSYVTIAWAFLVAHPYYVVLALTALASVAYKKADGYPRIHAILSILAGIGIDLPTILDAIRRLFTGSPPTVGKAGPYRTAAKVDPDVTQDKPAARWLVWPGIPAVMMFLFFILPFWVAGPACTKQQTQQAVQNFTPAGICIVQQVESGNVDPLAIIAACGAVTVQDIFNEVVALLSARAPGDGGTKVTMPTEFQTHLLTLKANCEKLMAAKDGG